MKKNILLILFLITIPLILHPETEDGIIIKKFTMEPVPYNERRDPVADSPYNAFDGDSKTAALYSNFTLEFGKPVKIDQIKIINGNASGKDNFKKNNRERDIEITLYTDVVYSPGIKEKKEKKKKTVNKKIQLKGSELKKEDSSKKTVPDKIDKDKTDKNTNEENKIKNEKIEKENTEQKNNDIKEKENEDREKNKTEIPEKVVYDNNFNKSELSHNGYVKLHLIADTVSDAEQKSVEDIKTENIEPVKKQDQVTNTSETKKKKTGNPKTKSTGIKKSEDDKNKIEIIESKKEKPADIKKAELTDDKSEEKNKEIKPENVKENTDDTEVKKSLAADQKPEVLKKKPEIKKTKAVKKKSDSKKTGKSKKSKANSKDKKKNKVKPSKKSAKKTEKKKTDTKKEIPANNKNKIEITETKEKTVKEDTPPEVKKNEEIQKDEKQDMEKKESTVTEIKKTNPEEKEAVKIDPDKPVEKIVLPEMKKKEEKKQEKQQLKKTTQKSGKEKTKKEKSKKDKSHAPDKKTEENKTESKTSDKKKVLKIDKEKKTEDVKVKKMTGIVRIENDNAGRILIYTTLKDSMEFQSISLKGEYTIKKIDFRTRDDEYYTGTEPDRSAITEISFFNKSKKIPFAGIDSMKKSYTERYNKALTDAISGQTFIMNDNNEIILRLIFKKDGGIEFFDRFKCRKKVDPDCTSLQMPDRWKITDGKLLMRYHTLWRVWKYELDSQSDMLDEENTFIEPPRWMKIYFKSENGFTQNYIDLQRSDNGVWSK